MTPFKFEELHINHSTIYFCSFEKFNPKDYFNYLSREEQQKVLTFKSPSRRMEFVASRVLRYSIFGFRHIEYTELGAPYIKDIGFISISHTHKLVAIICNPNYKVGIDLENPRTNILDIAPKFLSTQEYDEFDTTSKIEVTKIWSSKETLYKLAGRKKIHFKSELLLSKDKDQNWVGTIINPDHTISVKLNIFEHNGIIVTLNDEKININKKHS